MLESLEKLTNHVLREESFPIYLIKKQCSEVFDVQEILEVKLNHFKATCVHNEQFYIFDIELIENEEYFGLYYFKYNLSLIHDKENKISLSVNYNFNSKMGMCSRMKYYLKPISDLIRQEKATLERSAHYLNLIKRKFELFSNLEEKNEKNVVLTIPDLLNIISSEHYFEFHFIKYKQVYKIGKGSNIDFFNHDLDNIFFNAQIHNNENYVVKDTFNLFDVFRTLYDYNDKITFHANEEDEFFYITDIPIIGNKTGIQMNLNIEYRKNHNGLVLTARCSDMEFSQSIEPENVLDLINNFKEIL